MDLAEILASASILRFLKNQKEIISVVVRRIEPGLLPNKLESTPVGVIAHELFGDAVAFEIFFPRFAGFGWRINYAQRPAGF